MILVDATTAEHATGIRVVIEGFLGGLAQTNSDHVLVAAGPRLRVPPPVAVRRIKLAGSVPGRLAYQRVLLPAHSALLNRRGLVVDRVLTLDSYLPLIRPGARSTYGVLIHDLLPVTHPAYWTRSKLVVRRAAFAAIRRGKPHVFVSSAHNAALAEQHLGLPSRVVTFGCGSLTDAEADEALSGGGLASQERGSSIVAVGAVEPRKGIATLIEAFERLADRLPGSPRLILAGPAGSGPGAGQVLGRLAASIHRHRIDLLGPRGRDEILRLIASARVLAFPSQAEGFGLPVLEALALGTPVVASDLPEIRNWAGDSVLYAPPSDSEAWASALQEAWHGAGAPTARGLELSGGFRWHRFAAELTADWDSVPSPPRADTP